MGARVVRRGSAVSRRHGCRTVGGSRWSPVVISTVAGASAVGLVGGGMADPGAFAVQIWGAVVAVLLDRWWRR